MRAPYIPPPIKAYEKLFINPSLRGKGLDDIQLYSPDNYSLRGSGILSFLAGLARRAVPFLMKTVAPESLNMAQNILTDINTGTSARQSLKTHGLESLKKVARKVITGGGARKKYLLKRLQTEKKKPKKKKKSFQDIFLRL